MSRPLLSRALLVLLVVACHPALEVDRERVQPEVLTMIRARGEAAVMIALTPPPGFGDPAVDQEQIRADIARMQAEVLAALDTVDFRARQPFASIPAMAGTLRTEQGLRTLLAHPHVRRVDLDPAGGGGH
jgi:alkylation response protein AidB-like acyl-CoA dehydrogenase